MSKSKKKETLMYVGGEPQQEGDSNKKQEELSEFDKKWAKIVSGEATVEQLGECFAKGDMKALKKGQVGNVAGFSKSADKMRVLVMHIGYSQEEMKSEEFQNYMRRSKTETQTTYGKRNIEVGFHVPDEDTPDISCHGFGHIIAPNHKELAMFKRKLQQKTGAIDIIDIRINPKVAKSDYFGLGGGNGECVTPGPSKTKSGRYKVNFKAISEHELMHCISAAANVANPTSFGDGYTRALYDSEEKEMAMGNHLEYIKEDPKNPGTPIKTKNKTMQKVLKEANLADENIFMVGRDGTKTKLLTVNPGTNIMRGSFTNGKRTRSIKAGTYISKAQKIAIKEVINDYLVFKERKKDNTKSKGPNLKTSNQSKVANDNKKTKKVVEAAIVNKCHGRG
jgi:hypothetical protein